jgi:hypothetical protein
MVDNVELGHEAFAVSRYPRPEGERRSIDEGVEAEACMNSLAENGFARARPLALVRVDEARAERLVRTRRARIERKSERADDERECGRVAPDGQTTHEWPR